jgi:hypothetical protein
LFILLGLAGWVCEDESLRVVTRMMAEMPGLLEIRRQGKQ